MKPIRRWPSGPLTKMQGRNAIYICDKCKKPTDGVYEPRGRSKQWLCQTCRDKV